MQFSNMRVAGARPAAATINTSHQSERCLVISQSTRHAGRGTRPPPKRSSENVDDSKKSSSRRTSTTKSAQAATPDARATKPHSASGRTAKAPPPRSETEQGLDGIDELLADPDAVQQLRSSLIAALSAQHQEALRAEHDPEEVGSSSTTTTSSAQNADHRNPDGAREAVKGSLPPTTNTNDINDISNSNIKENNNNKNSTKSNSKSDKSSTSSSSNTTNRSSKANGEAANADSDVPLVVLKKDKARLFVYGNPMVYGGAVDCVIGRPPPGIGDVVRVASSSRRTLGWGVYNPHSMFRVRLLQLQPEHGGSQPQSDLSTTASASSSSSSPAPDLPALLTLRLHQAAALRRTLGLPGPHTNVYRLVNSEGDGLSGLVVDVLGDTVVVQAVAGWVQRYRSDVEAAIRGATGLARIVWRPMWKILAEEGLQPPGESEGADGEGAEGAAGGEGGAVEGGVGGGEGVGVDAGEDLVEVREAGLRLLASPQGQKTGFYADQRDSRAFLASLVAAQKGTGTGPAPTVLDLCCYSGGFALAAAAAGAAAAVGVDSSEPAISLATANAQLNGLNSIATFVRQDVAEYMKAAIAEGRQYDMVVLDPPKLAPDRASLGRARAKYLRLNAAAMQLVRPGGILMTCSCSGAMTQSGEFMDMVLDAARQVGRQVTLLRQAGAAPDHPLHPAYPEGRYLTNVTLRLL